jgi:hypothetical protein
MAMSIKPEIKINRLPMKEIEKEIRYVWKEFGNVWGYGVSKKTRNLIGKPVVAGEKYSIFSKRAGKEVEKVRKFRKTRAQGKPPTSRVPDSSFGLRFNTQPHYHKTSDYVMRAGFQAGGHDGGTTGVTELLEFGGMTSSWHVYKPGKDYITRGGVTSKRKPDAIVFDENVYLSLRMKHRNDGWHFKYVTKYTYHPSLKPASEYYTPRAQKEFTDIMTKRLSPGGMSKKVQGIRKRKGMG